MCNSLHPGSENTGDNRTSYEESATENLQIMEGGSVPIKELPSTEYEEKSVIYIAHHFPAKIITYEETEVTIERPGWTEVRTIIFHLC